MESVPFSEEVSGSIDEEEELFLGLGAVSRVEVVLQRNGPLQGADHIDGPLLEAPAGTQVTGQGLRGDHLCTQHSTTTAPVLIDWMELINSMQKFSSITSEKPVSYMLGPLL